MTNITEADHDAVDWLYEMGVIAPHHLRLANEAFARHREQTERQSADRIEALEAENERLREALIKGGPTAGGSLPDIVSTGFLMLVPEEVSAKIKPQYNGKIYLPLKNDHDAAKRARAALGEKQ